MAWYADSVTMLEYTHTHTNHHNSSSPPCLYTTSSTHTHTCLHTHTHFPTHTHRVTGSFQPNEQIRITLNLTSTAMNDTELASVVGSLRTTSVTVSRNNTYFNATLDVGMSCRWMCEHMHMYTHAAHTRCTYTLHIHTAHTHCTYTLHIHAAQTRCTYTLHNTHPYVCLIQPHHPPPPLLSHPPHQPPPPLSPNPSIPPPQNNTQVPSI